MKTIVYFQAISEAIAEEMIRDDKVFVLGEDVQQGTFMETTGLVQQFGPERIIDTPISETAIAGAAVGSALAGYRPIADMYMADFFLVAGAEILMNAAKWSFMHAGRVKVPCVFLVSVGGGMKLAAEHSATITGYLMHTPGIKVAFPSNPYDLKGLLKTAIRDDGPVVVCYHKGILGMPQEIPEEEYLIDFNKADIKRRGDDVTVVAVSNMVNLALAVADEIKDTISVEVIDPRTIAPLDIDTIVTSVKKTGRLVVVDEDVEVCGITAEIIMQVIESAFDFLDAPPKRVAAANMPIPGGVLEQHALPQPDDIRKAIEDVFNA